MTLFSTFANNIVIYLIPFHICFAFFKNMKKSQIQFLYKKFRELQCFNLKMYFYLKSLNNYTMSTNVKWHKKVVLHFLNLIQKC